MAWTNVEHHVFSERWRLSSLFWPFAELILGFIVLICAIISVATTKLIRSSGLCLSCHSCDQGRGARGSQKHPGLCQNPQNKPQQPTGNSTLGRQLGNGADMSFTCELCGLRLSDCSCSAEQSSKPPPPTPPAKTFSSREGPPPPPLHFSAGPSSSPEYHSCCPGHLQEDDGSCLRVDSFSSEIIDDPSANERSVRDATIGAEKTSGLYGSECRLCNLAMSRELSSLSGRPLKRKFAKVFPGDTRDGSPRSQTQEFGDSASGIAKKTPVGGIHHHADRGDSGASLNLFQEEIVVDDESEDADQLSSMPKQFVVSDAEDAENLRKASWEESSGNSSNGSFTYIRRFPVDFGRSVEASGNRKGEGVSNDSQFGRGGRGDLTPEWSGSYEVSHSFDEMEGGSSVANQDDDDDRFEYCGVKELKEALRAERKVLSELYNELDQERSASATAANEAMAMITRLQEEKAAAQMECRQFQRMAEEKQLYDQEAIALLQDILVRRDQQMFNLEEEAKLYRQRLLALTMDELDRAGGDPSGAPEKKSDFLLIERETLLLEGKNDWKNNKIDSREERLLAEIKEWVTAANEKVAAKAPANVPSMKEDEESAEKAKLSWKISNMSIDSGRKNLLESFRSVGGDEENQRDGGGSEAGSEDIAARNDTAAAAGYESFHTMMDSLRKEPRLRDEASLETLNKIEEKFQKQSKKGKVRNEDDLRQIWKNTLRSFGPGAGENVANRALKKQDANGQTEEMTDNSGLMSGIVRDAEANRAMEQKKISVLEYVWKFEEQLHHAGAKKPVLQLGRTNSSDINRPERSASSVSESGLLDQSGTKGAVMEFSATESEREKLKRRSPGDGTRLPPSRFRRHASEGDRFNVRAEVAPSPKSAAESQERRSESSFRHEKDESGEGSLVHDVYEVQREGLETSKPKRSDSLYNDEVRKSVFSTSSKLWRGESAYFPESDEYMEFLRDQGDRLGKPDPLPGYHLSEREANGKGRFCSQAGTGRYITSLSEDDSLEQDFDWPATSTSGRDSDTAQAAGGRTPQTPTPVGKMGNVVDQLTARLKTLEADRETMQQTISSFRAENGEMQLLREIAQQLRELRGMDQKASNSTEPQEPTLASSIKGMLSFSRLRCSVQAQLNKLARVFLRNVELGVCRGDQHVGLCRLLQISPQRPIRVTRGAEAAAEEIVLNGSQEVSLQPAAPRPSTLLSQQSWPMDVRERSGTALSGWDY